MKLRLFTIVCLFCYASQTQAQLSPGVKIGLNFSQIKGPSEEGPTDAALETTSNLTGFLIGPSFAYPFTDNFGIRGEFLYSKKGSKYTFTGPAVRSFVQDGDQTIVSTSGTKSIALQVTHNNLDIPLMLYARLGKVEVSGGAYLSMLFSKVADGEQIYEWENQDGSDGRIANTLTYNYNKDKFGEGDNAQSEIAYFNTAQTRKSTLPKTFGAYYDYNEDRGNLYKFVDYGLSAGASIYVSRSLFVGARLQYGLADLTNNNADQSKYERDDNGFLLFRNDKDLNYNIQVFAGFSLR